MATLTVQDIVLAGLEATYDACTGGGDEFVNTGREFIHFINGDAADKTITIDSQNACNQGSDHDVPVVCTANEERLIGPFPGGRFNDANNKVQITYSAVTSCTIAIIRLP
jgi:hypothetical protein